MTVIDHQTEIEGAGNNDMAGAFDVIFPLISSDTDPTHALASHPILKIWSNAALSSVTGGTGDTKVFWQTSPQYDAGPDPYFLGTMFRAIPTWEQSSGVDWALNANMTNGTGDPATGKGRILKGDSSYLPLLAAGEALLGDGNTLQNRAPFNFAAVIHSATSDTANALLSYISIHYTFANTDPGMVVRGNTNTGGEPDPTDIEDLDHDDMKSLWGDQSGDSGDITLVGSNFSLRHSDGAASNSNPFMVKPTSGFKACEKIVAWDLNA